MPDRERVISLFFSPVSRAFLLCVELTSYPLFSIGSRAVEEA